MFLIIPFLILYFTVYRIAEIKLHFLKKNIQMKKLWRPDAIQFFEV